jgi:hypothetical protein
VHFQPGLFVIISARSVTRSADFPRQPERNHKVVFVLLNKWGNRKVPGLNITNPSDEIDVTLPQGG